MSSLERAEVFWEPRKVADELAMQPMLRIIVHAIKDSLTDHRQKMLGAPKKGSRLRGEKGRAKGPRPNRSRGKEGGQQKGGKT